MVKQKTSLLLLAILILAFISRLAMITILPQEASDSGKYVKLAKNITKYGAFTFDGQKPDDSRAPMYPLFISVLSRNNINLYKIRLVQATLDSLAVIIIFFITQQIFRSKRMSLLSSFLYATSPSLIASTSFILSETLSIFFLLLSALLLSITINQKKMLLLLY